MYIVYILYIYSEININKDTSHEKNDFEAANLAAMIENGVSESEMNELLRQSGVFRRKPRKLTSHIFIRGLLSLAFENIPTLENVAGTFSLLLGGSYSKQATQKRMNSGVVRFLASLLRVLFQKMAGTELQVGIFAPFNRVLLQDSTSVALPERYKRFYPGSDNQYGSNSVMKFQMVMELASCRITELSISSYRRNDQSATGDIFNVARRGDLVLRDLGYFCYDSFETMIDRGIFFISRLCGQIPVLDPNSLDELKLSKELARANGVFDRILLIGKKKRIPVRLVATPVPEQIANERRRKAHSSRNRRYSPTRERLRLMSWNIMITNVPADMLSSEQVIKAYNFRWRIEVVFKAWKSMLAFEHLNFYSIRMLHVSVILKLILCFFTQSTASRLETLACMPQKHVSVLRVARTIGDLKPLFMICLLGVTPEKFLAFRLLKHSSYEHRNDRMNFFENLYADTPPTPLG